MVNIVSVLFYGDMKIYLLIFHSSLLHVWPRLKWTNKMTIKQPNDISLGLYAIDLYNISMLIVMSIYCSTFVLLYSRKEEVFINIIWKHHRIIWQLFRLIKIQFWTKWNSPDKNPRQPNCCFCYSNSLQMDLEKPFLNVNSKNSI